MKFLTLTWDDGFSASMLKLAAIYEKFGLRAEINVLARPHDTSEAWLASPMGDFGLWNELQARGHVIQPHGVDHTNKAQIPLADAQARILRCLDIFSAELDGFDARRTIFNFPYNASTPEIEAWLPSVVRAFRTGHTALNPLPGPGTTKITTSGWADAEPWLHTCVQQLVDAPEGWLVYNAHGLDGEGWGPIRSTVLERVLAGVLERGDIHILPAGEVLDRCQGA